MNLNMNFYISHKKPKNLEILYSFIFIFMFGLANLDLFFKSLNIH
jgi:hypothetical protein